MTTPPSASFSSFAFLVGPVGDGASVLAAEADWSLPAREELVDAGALVWGRGPQAGLKSFGVALRYALTRDRVLQELRRAPPPPFRSVAVHLMPPASLGPPGPRSRVRQMLLGGAAAVLSRDERPQSVVDAVIGAAGATAAGPVRPRSGGGAIARVSMPGVDHGILRLARIGEPSDPARGLEGLERLARDQIPLTPRPLAYGETAGASWALETSLEGARPRRIGRSLAARVAAFLRGLPASGEAPTALAEDLAAIGEALPNRARALASIGDRLAAVVSALPGVLRHGDLWAGNVLIERGRLSGVVDWDAWHPSAVPGADLLHLVVTEERRKTGRALGAAWEAKPWRSRAYAGLAAEGWRALGVRPDDDALEAIGVAWWAAAVAGTLARLPHRAKDDPWLAANIDPVLRALSA